MIEPSETRLSSSCVFCTPCFPFPFLSHCLQWTWVTHMGCRRISGVLYHPEPIWTLQTRIYLSHCVFTMVLVVLLLLPQLHPTPTTLTWLGTFSSLVPSLTLLIIMTIPLLPVSTLLILPPLLSRIMHSAAWRVQRKGGLGLIPGTTGGLDRRPFRF